MDQKMSDALNQQINAELYSSYLYYSMASYCKRLNLEGFARWMEVQVLEELTHVSKFFNFVNERGGKVELKAIAGPSVSWDSPLAVFEAVHEHEVKVTGLIYDLVNLATEMRDHATVNFLQWFINEQVEEETSADNIVKAEADRRRRRGPLHDGPGTGQKGFYAASGHDHPWGGRRRSLNIGGSPPLASATDGWD